MTTTRHVGCPHVPAVANSRPSELSRKLRAHSVNCADCTRAQQALQARLDAARAIGPEPLTPARSEQLRARLLESASRRRRTTRSRRPLVLSLGVAAAAAVALWVSSARDGNVAVPLREAPRRDTTASAPSFAEAHGTVRASAGAHFTRVSDEPDEIVRLVDGSITVSVTPLGPGERFRVIVGDAEVEVRGTAFDVSAIDDHLSSVHVFHGRVEVRREGESPVMLEADDRWVPPADPAAEALRGETDRAIHDAVATGAERALHPRATAATAGRPEEPPASAGADESWTPAGGFETGWNALRSGDPARAAEAFGTLVERAPDDALAEDASFWRGVALSRSGRASDARASLAAFVRDYPSSVRANEAAVMLGWLLVEDGDADAARAMFERGRGDASDRIRASAERGLATITPH